MAARHARLGALARCDPAGGGRRPEFPEELELLLRGIENRAEGAPRESAGWADLPGSE